LDLIELTIPEKPQSKNQKLRLTPKGEARAAALAESADKP
jgi:hypothetical protein